MPFRKTEAIAADLTRRIGEEGWPEGGVLPPVRALAGSYGTSTLTITRVLRKLRAERLIRKRDEKGDHVVCTGRNRPVDPRPAVARFAQVAAKLHMDLLTGAVSAPEGLLHGQKDLARRYHCCAPVVRRALQHLVAQGIIERCGRQYALAAAPRLDGANVPRVYLCGTPAILSGGNPLFHSCIRGIENEIHDIQWSQPALMVSSAPLTAEPPGSQAVAGYILLSRTRGWWNFYARQSAVPVVYVDAADAGYWSRGAPSRRAFHLRADNVDAGLRVGLHLQASGHRHVAFINPLGTNLAWTCRRLEGLSTVHPRNGGNRSVGVRVFGADGSAGLPVDSGESSLITCIRALRGQAMAQPYLLDEVVSERLWGCYELSAARTLARTAWPLFEKALRCVEFTAWVCVNDSVAALALAFLARNHVSVPRRIALASFDNSVLAYRLGITSWDPNLEGMGRLAVRCLATPDAVSRKDFAEVTVTGRLIVRGSTGR